MQSSRNQLAKLIHSQTTKPLHLFRRLTTSKTPTNEQNPPDPIPNRPLRPQNPNTTKSKTTNFDQKDIKSESPLNFRNMVGDGFENDASFLEKFKLNAAKDKKVISSEATGDVKVEEGSGPVQDADEIFKNLKKTGLIPNAVEMLDGLCKDGLVHEAMKLFGVMREKGTVPEVVAYTAVVDAFCKARKAEDAKRVFKKMQGNGIVPNAFSFGVLVQGLCRCGEFDESVEFCLEMLEAGHSPNVATFVGLIDGVCREKGVEEGKGVIRRLVEKGFFLNERAIKEFIEKKLPFSPMLLEAIFGKKTREKVF